MTKFADLHTHTPLCKHAAGSAAAFAAAAQKKNLAFLGASDHFPAPAGFNPEARMEPGEWGLYLEWVAALRRELASSPVEVLFACEYDFVPGRMAEVRAALAEHDFDYRISSIHFAGDFELDNPELKAEWQARGVDAVWNRYAEIMAAMIEDGGFEVIGHLDLPKKFGFYPSDRTAYARKMRPVLELAGQKNICMELNTAGLRKEVREIYPAPELVQCAFESGVRITFGSDAHAPCEVGADFDRAQELAESAGYRCAWAFRRGVPVELPFH